MRVPWLAYNIPRYTGNPLGAALVERLAARPGCLGLKDSSGDLALRRTRRHPRRTAGRPSEPFRPFDEDEAAALRDVLIRTVHVHRREIAPRE